MYDGTDEDLVRQLADRAGIAEEYHEISGTRHVTSDATRRAILSAMGFRTETREALVTELTRWDEAIWHRHCEPVLVVREGYRQIRWSFCVPVNEEDQPALQVTWEIRGEDGTSTLQGDAGPNLLPVEVRVVDGIRCVRVELQLDQGLNLGYYDLIVTAHGVTSSTSGTVRLIVAPVTCYVPDSLQRDERTWGVALQLYSLRSARNWGVGDFTDLEQIVDWVGTKLQAGVIGLNPLHALKNSRPYHLSPYSPNSRLYVNDLYIDVERVPEFHAGTVQRVFKAGACQGTLADLRKGDLVDYDATSALKRSILDLCYRQFLREHFVGKEPSLRPSTGRGRLFEQFVASEGEALERFATFQALEDLRGVLAAGGKVWQEWPEPYRSASSEGVRRFAQRHRKRVRFFQYLQWIAAEQLNAIVEQGKKLHLPIGLYHDLALGSDRCGADAWSFQDVLALDADCGAPPDPFALQGQNWGIAPFHPLRLREVGYQPFIELLRHNMRRGGAVRLDHVMALFRLFWIPRGQPASVGTYVKYPAEDLLAILALESRRTKTLVVGEDLGTVPDWVRARLTAAKVLSYRVFYFERNQDGSFKRPSQYPAQSLAVVTTHDLPTLAGYWSGEDIHARAQLGLYPDEQAKQQDWRGRQEDKARILAVLKMEGLLPHGISEDVAQVPIMTPELCRAVYAYLGRTPAWLVLVGLEDLIGEVSQANLPGTLDNYPNWRRKLSADLETLQHDDQGVRMSATLAMVRGTRPVT